MKTIVILKFTFYSSGLRDPQPVGRKTAAAAKSPPSAGAVAPTNSKAATAVSTTWKPPPSAVEGKPPTPVKASAPTTTKVAAPTMTKAAAPTAAKAAAPTKTKAAAPTKTKAASPTKTKAAAPTKTVAPTKTKAAAQTTAKATAPSKAAAAALTKAKVKEADIKAKAAAASWAWEHWRKTLTPDKASQNKRKMDYDDNDDDFQSPSRTPAATPAKKKRKTFSLDVDDITDISVILDDSLVDACDACVIVNDDCDVVKVTENKSGKIVFESRVNEISPLPTPAPVKPPALPSPKPTRKTTKDFKQRSKKTKPLPPQTCTSTQPSTSKRPLQNTNKQSSTITSTPPPTSTTPVTTTPMFKSPNTPRTITKLSTKYRTPNKTPSTTDTQSLHTCTSTSTTAHKKFSFKKPITPTTQHISPYDPTERKPTLPLPLQFHSKRRVAHSTDILNKSKYIPSPQACIESYHTLQKVFQDVTLPPKLSPLPSTPGKKDLLSECMRQSDMCDMIVNDCLSKPWTFDL